MRIAIVLRNQSIIVRVNDTKLLHVIKTLNEEFKLYDFAKTRYGVKRVLKSDFTCGNIYRHEAIYPDVVLPKLIRKLRDNNLTANDIGIEDGKEYDVECAEINLKGDKVPRDHQIEFIDALSNLPTPYRALVALATGKGKTFIAANEIVNRGERVLIHVLPRFITKWVNDVLELTDTLREEILLVQGGDDLNKLISMSSELSRYKFIIISNRTMFLYIKEYESLSVGQVSKYPVSPTVLVRHLNIGIVLIDEVHMEYLSNFKSILYLDPKRVLSLSATLENKDRQLQQLYDTLFDNDKRLDFYEEDPYIHVFAVKYSFRASRELRFSNGEHGYSQNEFEKSLINNKYILKFYLDMIGDYADKHYIERRRDGEKLLVFAGLVEMCDIIVSYLSKRYSDLDTRRYVKGDPYEDVMDPDIRVSTVLKSGTALDIKGLTTVLQTINISSIQSNKQSIGRLRDIPGTEVRFVYFYSANIKSHLIYHSERRDHFASKALKYNLEEYKTILG